MYYLSICFDSITYVFVVFNNIEEIPFIRKRLLNKFGNIIISRLSVLRLATVLVMMSPLLFLTDLFFFRILVSGFISTTIGFFWPVSL